MEGKKALVLKTVAAALFVFGVASTYQVLHKPISIAMTAGGFVSMGTPSAPVEIVLIEDLRCRNCRKFTETIIPKIQAEYVQTGKVRFTLVPVSFLLGSQAMANAALEVYQQHPDRFFPYLKEIFINSQKGDLKKEELLRLARRVGGIDLAQLQRCIEMGCHDKELESNLSWAREMMGLNFRTPALYINGAPGSTFSFEAIKYQVEQILGKK